LANSSVFGYSKFYILRKKIIGINLIDRYFLSLHAKPVKMNQLQYKSKHLSNILIPIILILSSCSESGIPVDLPGTYNGRERVVIKYDRGGQYIYRDDYVMVSMMIDESGQVIGMVGDAMFEGCSVKQNRGWIARQLGIKTDFLIKGMLKGNTFDKDTMLNKVISIPFNNENGELKGSLILTTKGDSYPIISILKLQKNKK
jgi:hypothetical protein